MEWREAYFEEGYLRRWSLPPADAEVREEARAFVHLAEVERPVRILDLGCGHGRYASALALEGHEVVGLDASRTLLLRAQRQAVREPGTVFWVRGDMGALPFSRRFDLVLIRDAFGYFDEEPEGAALLVGVGEVLRSRGRLILRNPNGGLIRRDFRADERKEHRDRRIWIRNRLEDEGRWLWQTVRIEDAEGRHEYERRQRLYAAGELEGLLRSVGYDSIEHFSDFEGSRFEEGTSSHIATVCRVADRF